jgi:sugar phosphate isomerase/epimerase
MQLGFVSAIVPDLSLEQVFQTAAGIGYDCVELMCWPAGKAERRYAGITHVDVSQFDDARAGEVLQLAASSGVAISGLGYYPNPLTPQEEESAVAVAHLKKVIVAARALNLSVVSTFVGRDWTKSVDDNWPRFQAVWTDIIHFAEDYGIRIAIENCPMLFTRDEWPGGKNLAHSPAVWRRMFETIPSSSFGLNYDPSHLVWQMMDYIRPLHDFRDRIFRIHLKDARVDRYKLNEAGIMAHPLEYHSPRLPGLGEIDWGYFIAALSDVGYDGPVCIEVEDRAFEATPQDRLRALRQSHDYIRKFINRGYTNDGEDR